MVCGTFRPLPAAGRPVLGIRLLLCVQTLFLAGSHCKSACALISGVTTVRCAHAWALLGSAGRITVATWAVSMLRNTSEGVGEPSRGSARAQALGL